MKLVTIMCILVAMLLLPTFTTTSTATTSTYYDLEAVPALPSTIPREPLPEDYVVDPELVENTTNPYAVESANEIVEEEGPYPIYVYLCIDEEESAKYPAESYAVLYALKQIERGDEALVANYGIDIRVLDYCKWESSDYLSYMGHLWQELHNFYGGLLGTWVNGKWWNGRVDAIIGITGQRTSDYCAGVASRPEHIDVGLSIVLLRWQAYWSDDNLVQHEISHLFYANDHGYDDPECCAMAYHMHYLRFIWEDGKLFWVDCNVQCAYIRYFWCSRCINVMNIFSRLYVIRATYQHTLILRQRELYNPLLLFSPIAQGVYGFTEPTPLEISASPECSFASWRFNRQLIPNNPIRIDVNGHCVLIAIPKPPPGPRPPLKWITRGINPFHCLRR